MFKLQVGSWKGKTGIVIEVGDFGDGEYERGVYGNPLDLIVMWEDGKIGPCASKDLVRITEDER